jgi:hypothetical protein
MLYLTTNMYPYFRETENGSNTLMKQQFRTDILQDILTDT